MPPRKEFLKLRNGNMKDYAVFFIELSSSVVSDLLWRNSIMIDCDNRMKYGERISSSDEAFILFVVLNSWVKWTCPQNCDSDFGVDSIDEDDKSVLSEWEGKRRICIDTHGHGSANLQKITVPNLYSGDKRRKGDGIQGRNGWSTQGIKRYNELYNMVKQDRRERGDAFAEVTIH
jgi:hypothetical protein